MPTAFITFHIIMGSEMSLPSKHSYLSTLKIKKGKSWVLLTLHTQYLKQY
jgi:hypothetical protein